MRAREFIVENGTGSLAPDVAHALPASYTIPKLQNQDPYLQYRFGMAIAGAKGAKQRAMDEVPDFETQSAWGENMVVVSFDPNIEEWIDDALKTVGLSPGDKKLISTPTSDEAPTVQAKSPVTAFKGYPK